MSVMALGLLLFALPLQVATFAAERFPPPDFESGYQLPVTVTPPARALFFQSLDMAVLVASLGLAAWLIYQKRTRKSIVLLSIFALLYFGCYRKGCVCSIGSLQNVALAGFDRGYALPLGVLVFFGTPLVFALFAGRTFCAAVCPHGALQDLVLLKPLKLPLWLEQGLGILPFIYLGAAVLFAATGSAFILCEYDPFVPIFRMSGRATMVLAGVALLLIGIFVGRPYCRFLCPYGALLKLASVCSKWRVRVTPDACTQCRLCQTSCPFGALREPAAVNPDPSALVHDRRRLAWLLALLPVLVLGGGWLGTKFGDPASRVHPTVRLAERLVREQTAPINPTARTADDLALERAQQRPEEIFTAAAGIRHNFFIGGGIFGAWVGLVIGAKLISLSLQRTRTDFEPDRGECVECARCFEYCPNELVRRGLMPAVAPPVTSPAPGLASVASPPQLT